MSRQTELAFHEISPLGQMRYFQMLPEGAMGARAKAHSEGIESGSDVLEEGLLPANTKEHRRAAQTSP